MKYAFFLVPFFLISCGETDSQNHHKANLEEQFDSINNQPFPSFLDSIKPVDSEINNVLQIPDSIRSSHYSANQSAFIQNQLIEICKLKRLKAFFMDLKKLEQSKDDSSFFKTSITLNRSIINDFKELEIEISFNKITGPSSFFVYTFIIQLISFGDEIVEYNLLERSKIRLDNEWSRMEIKPDLFNNRDQNLYKQFKDEYFERYSKNLDSLQLWNSQITYGDQCGYNGSPPKYRIRLAHMVELKDVNTILNWLKSNNVELQLYAIEGVLILQKQGLRFDKNTFELIDVIEKKEGNAITCSGCIYWQQPINEIVKKIKEELSYSK